MGIVSQKLMLTPICINLQAKLKLIIDLLICRNRVLQW